MMKLIREKKGTTLAVSLILLITAGIVVSGLVVFLDARLTSSGIRRLRMQTIELAQAGIEFAAFVYRRTERLANREGRIWLGRQDIDAQNFFILGGADADLLMVDVSGSTITSAGGKRQAVTGFRLKNATNARGLRIGQLFIQWNNNKKLKSVILDGRTYPVNGTGRSPVSVTLNPPFRLDRVPNTYTNNALVFSGAMAGSTVQVDFFLQGDGSTQSVEIYPSSNHFDFTVESTGKVSGSEIQRTVRARYNTLTSRIENCYEISSHRFLE